MNDDQLRRMLSDAVSDVEPEDRLDQIRASVHSDPKVVPMSRTRSWRYAAVGVAATVAVIGGVAYAAGDLPGSHRADNHTPTGPVPSSHHTRSNPSTPVSSPTTATSTTATATGTKAYAVYYVGTDPRGKPVLFREFHRGAASQATTNLALADLGTLPLDPDYTTSWHAGDFAGVNPNRSGSITVLLHSRSLETRPAGMSTARAKAAIQQVVYTVQAALQTRAPVLFKYHETSMDHVLGVRTNGPVAAGDALKTLSLMSISNPNEGDQVSGTLTVSGANNAFEASLVVYLERNGQRFLMTPGMASGAYEHKLFPWTVTLDLSKVQPGRYTLVAANDDPTGNNRPSVDTRTIIVK